MGYFKHVNFIFLIVGHTKNAADRLFNSLKHEYHKKNLFNMEDLIESLNVADCVTVIPTVPEDFFKYDALFKVLYRDLARNVKQNHIFSCIVDDQMNLRKSNIDDHKIHKHTCSKKSYREITKAELKLMSTTNLVNVECVGINPYKMVKLHFKYRIQVPIEYRNNILY
jgi:hypothetical protein